MADLPISGLPSAGALSGTETLAIVQSGATKQTTVQDVANLAGTTPPLADVLNQGNTSGPNDIVFDASQGLQFNNSSKLREGTTDAGLEGNNGIAQVCSLDYELKWEAGRLYVMQQDGTTIRQSLYNFTTTPTATDDSTKGYAVGSLWTLDDGTTYECIDATATSADWIESSQSKFIEVTKAQLLALEGAGTLSVNVWYKVTDALANTAKILVSALSTSVVSKAAVNLTDNSFGQYTLSSDYYVPISGTVTSVNAGTNISVTGTATDPIINSLADRYKTTSLSNILIGNGSRTFTVDANLAYIPLQEVLIVYDASNHMHGTVTSYSGTTLVVDVKNHTGSGTYASWVINLDGMPVDAITGVGTVNRLAYFTAAQVIDDAAAITAARALKSDANGIPTHFDTATEPSLTELTYVKGVTSAIQTQLDAKTDTITSFVLVGTWTTPAGATTTYVPIWGNITTPLGTITTLLTSLPYANRVIGIFVQHFNNTGTRGTNENFAIRLRNNTTSTSTQLINIQTNQASGVIKNFNASGLTVDSAANDELAIEFLAPTWATNPTNLQLRIVLFIQKI